MPLRLAVKFALSSCGMGSYVSYLTCPPVGVGGNFRLGLGGRGLFLLFLGFPPTEGPGADILPAVAGVVMRLQRQVLKVGVQRVLAIVDVDLAIVNPHVPDRKIEQID